MSMAPIDVSVESPIHSSIDVSIVITSFNTRQLLLDCLVSIPAAVGSMLAEVIVVDNGSADGSVEAVQESFPYVRLVANKTNAGFVRGNNQGFALAKGRYVLMLNSDAFPRTGAIEGMLAFGDAHPEIGIIGARLLFPDDSPQNSWADFPTLLSDMTGRNFQRHAQPVASPGWNALHVDWVNGAAMLCRKSMLDALGGLDEKIFMYSEETDLCFRAHKAGWQVAHLADAAVTHLGGASSSSHDIRKLKLLYGGKLYFSGKHYGKLRTFVLRLGLIGATLFGLARRGIGAVLRPSERSEASVALAARWQLLWWLILPNRTPSNANSPLHSRGVSTQ